MPRPPSSPKLPTLVEVARIAGVSPSTASRALNGGRRVSPELTARVNAAARGLGYAPVLAARVLRGRRELVAMVADDPRLDTIGEMMAAMEGAAREAGVVATLSAAGGQPRRQLELVAKIRAMSPRALVLTGAWLRAPQIRNDLRSLLDEFVHADGGRVVILGRAGFPYPSVGFDDTVIGLQVARHMCTTETDRVEILAGPANDPALRDRVRGIRQAAHEAGIDDVHVTNTAPNSLAAEHAVTRAAGACRDGAILAVNDRLAVGALHALEALGIDVPGRVRVSGIEDIPLAKDLTPGLTTISLPFDAVGREAVRLAVSVDTSIPHRTLFGGGLVVRESSRRS